MGAKPFEGKKVAILGGTRISSEIVGAAKDLGMITSVLDYYPYGSKSPAKAVADAHAQISVADANAVAEYVQENCIDGLITGYTDSILGMYADACAASNLPCCGTRIQFETFSDKRKWKKLCLDHGVPTSKPIDISDPLRVRSVPILIKSADGSGSRGVSIVRDAGDIPSAVEHAQNFSKSGDILGEEYLEGPEVTIFWVFVDGRYDVFMAGDRIVKDSQGGANLLPVGYLFPSRTLPCYLEEVAPRVREMLADAGVRNGMMFMQCIVRDGLPYVYDIGYRLTGSLEHVITKDAVGFSPMDMLLSFAVTGRMTEDPDITEKIERARCVPAFNVSFLMRPGVPGSYDGLEAVEVDPVVISCVPARAIGEELPFEAVGELRQIALRVLGRVDHVEQLKEAVLRVQYALRILSPAGEDLTLPGFTESDFGRLGL